jgi:hypothetical protein
VCETTEEFLLVISGSENSCTNVSQLLESFYFIPLIPATREDEEDDAIEGVVDQVCGRRWGSLASINKK